jgi:hypothetical protein
MTTQYDDREPLSVRPRITEPPWHMSWAAVFAGSTLALGIWLMLYLLGLGVGLTVIDPDNAGSLRGAGMTTGIWSLIVPLVAMFVGGLAAAKVGGAMTRTSAAIQGGVVWSLATLGSMFALVSIVGSMIGGAARLGANAAASVGGMANSMAPTALSAVTGDDLLAPINQRLQATGKPAITADQLNNALRQALQTGVREGRMDREVLVQSLSTTTALSPEDSREIAASVERRYDDAAADLGTRAQNATLQAAETTGKGLIGMFVAMLLGLIAAVGGSIVGITRGQLAVAERVNERAERLAERHA